MPKSGITILSEFTPFSFERYLLPLQQYGLMYSAVEEGLTKLNEEASVWEKLADSAKDLATYNKYKAYLKDVQALADKLANEGLTMGTRLNLMNLRSRYKSEITPIESAWNYREKLAEELRKLNPAGDLLYTNDFSNISLEDIMKNPEIGYRGISQSQWLEEGRKVAAAASTRLNFSLEKALDFGSLYLAFKLGYTNQDVNDFIKDMNRNPLLKNLFDLVYDSIDKEGLSNYLKDLLKERVLDGMLEGLVLDTKPLENRDYLEGRASSSSSGSGSDISQSGIPLLYRGLYKDAEGNQKWFDLNSENKPISKEEGDTKKYFIPVTNKKGNNIISSAYIFVPTSGDKKTGYVISVETGLPVVDSMGRQKLYNLDLNQWDMNNRLILSMLLITSENIGVPSATISGRRTTILDMDKKMEIKGTPISYNQLENALKDKPDVLSSVLDYIGGSQNASRYNYITNGRIVTIINPKLKVTTKSDKVEGDSNGNLF